MPWRPSSIGTSRDDEAPAGIAGPRDGVLLCGDRFVNGTKEPVPGPLSDVGDCLRCAPFLTRGIGEELWLEPLDSLEEALAGSALTPLLDEVIWSELCSDDISCDIIPAMT